MKQAISGPVGIVIVVVVVGLLVFLGYNMFLKGPGAITPEDMRKNMQKGQQQQQEAYKNRRGPGGAPGMGAPGTAPGTGGAPSGQ